MNNESQATAILFAVILLSFPSLILAVRDSTASLALIVVAALAVGYLGCWLIIWGIVKIYKHYKRDF